MYPSGRPFRRDVWLGAAWLGAAWLGAAWLGAAWLGAAWLGAAWLGAAWLGAAWLGGVTRLAGRHLPALHAGPKLDQFPSPAFSRSATRSSTLDSNSAVRIGSIATSRASPSPFPSLHVDRLPYTLHASNRMPIFPYPPIPASPSFNHPTFPPPLLPPIPSSPPPPPPLPLSPTLNLAVARHSQVGLLDADVFAPHCPTCLACTLSPPPPSCPLGLETAGCPLLASPFPHACRRTACSACPLTWAGSVGFLMPAHQGGTTGEGQQGRGGSASKATLPAHALSSAGDAHAPMRSLPPAARADENGGAMDVVVVMMAMDATSSAGSTKALECGGCTTPAAHPYCLPAHLPSTMPADSLPLLHSLHLLAALHFPLFCRSCSLLTLTRTGGPPHLPTVTLLFASTPTQLSSIILVWEHQGEEDSHLDISSSPS
ncbi:unnamed protein product [Closterium sp. NIES-64]|nr:unnamed protein product [Closterium sp. NIES-64]